MYLIFLFEFEYKKKKKTSKTETGGAAGCGCVDGVRGREQLLTFSPLASISPHLLTAQDDRN